MPANLIKKHSEAITHNTVGSVIATYLIQGVPSAVALLTALIAHFRNGVPLYVGIILGVVVFFLLSLAWYFIGARRRGLAPPIQSLAPAPLDAQARTEMERLSRDKEAAEIGRDLRAQELEKYAWLHEIAEAQAREIHHYVRVERVVMIDPHDPTPSINFYFYIRNQSNYHVTIDGKVAGVILFEGRPLTYPLTVLGNELIEFPPLKVGVLTISQPLRPEEVDHISQFGDTAGYYVSVNQLQISARGGENFPHVTPQLLSTKDIVPEFPTPNIKELKDRIKQLEAEKATRAKPDITGKIKSVYFAWWANGQLTTDERMCFDYHFIVNAFVTNRGAVTTIESFNLVLRVGEHTYDGEREKDAHDVEDPTRNWRQWGAGELDDLEKHNDEPLQHSRNGSLWLVVVGVPNTEEEASMTLELYAVDKDGISHLLGVSPRPQWERNPFLHKAQVAAERAKLQREF